MQSREIRSFARKAGNKKAAVLLKEETVNESRGGLRKEGEEARGDLS